MQREERLMIELVSYVSENDWLLAKSNKLLSVLRVLCGYHPTFVSVSSASPWSVPSGRTMSDLPSSEPILPRKSLRMRRW